LEGLPSEVESKPLDTTRFFISCDPLCQSVENLCHKRCQHQGALSFHPRGVLAQSILIAQKPFTSPAIRMPPAIKILTRDMEHEPGSFANPIKASHAQGLWLRGVKEQKTCQRLVVHLMCWLALTIPDQGIERVGQDGVG
jgi:hypothetical protein